MRGRMVDPTASDAVLDGKPSERTAPDRPGAFQLWGVRDQRQARHAEIVVPVVGEQRCVVQQRGGGDPGVGALDPAAGHLCRDHNLSPLAAEIRT